MTNTSAPWDRFETTVRRDPGGRGVASYRWNGQPLGQGQLEQASRSLAEQAKAVAIVTGFCVSDGQSWFAETDGPPGALYLARALLELGAEVLLLSDAYGLPVLEAGCDRWQLPSSMLREIPFEDPDVAAASRQNNEPLHCNKTDAWARALLRSPEGRRLTHLIAIERPGPSHTLESLAAQPREGLPPSERFVEEVPSQLWNRCHNMRGVPVDAHTAKAHRLFEIVREQRLPTVTIGLADGGNEIGMGKFPWEVLRAAISQGPGGKIACRIATDYTLVAGVSNWAAYALTAGLCCLRGRRELLATWNAASQRDLIEYLVRNSPVVDGVTKRREPTVDGLPADEYLQVLRDLGQAVLGPGN